MKPTQTSNPPNEDILERSLKELADIKFALDQSTIVAITDQRGAINYVNDEFCRISKYSRSELLGQDHRIINSGFHPKDFIRELWTTIASGQVWKGELRNRAKDGSIYWVDTTIVPYLNSEGKPYQYVSIRHEITERKQAEARVLEQAAELQRATQLSFVGELAAGLAHEIKNPLAGIQGAVDILIRRRDKNDPEREALEGVRHEVSRIDNTVRALLGRAQGQAGFRKVNIIDRNCSSRGESGQKPDHDSRDEWSTGRNRIRSPRRSNHYSNRSRSD